MASLQDQINNYEEQISLIQAQIAEGDESGELQETLNDLNELITLLKDEIETESPTSSSSQNDEECKYQLDDLIGSRVLVEYPTFSKMLKYHSAIVLDIEPNQDNEGFVARVLFSAPLEMSMKPCVYFLKGTCKFENDCKFSHGEAVPLEKLEEYILPDFSQVKEGSLVLIPNGSGLFEVARIEVLDKNESAVKLLKSGKEVSTLNSAMIPLDDRVNCEQQDELLRQPNTSWSELKTSSMGEVSVGDLGQWNGGGFGFKMLQKMGYKLGQGLGKYNDGIVHSVQAKTYAKGKGLGSEQGIVASKLTIVPKKNKIIPAKFIGEQENEIFDFINKKLGYMPLVEELEMDTRKLKKSSERVLGTKNIEIELEIKKLRSNEKKLQEGIHRIQNKKDPDAVKKMEHRLKALQKDIQRLERQYSNLKNEQTERRQKKRDVF